MQQKQKAVIYMMISVILFSLMQLFISMTSPAANIFQQVFFRNFLGMGICIYYIRKEKQTEKIPYFGDLKSQPYLLGRSLFGFLGLLLMFYATRHALLADVTILTRTGPLFTTLVAVFFLHEKLPRIQIPVLVVIFAGGWLAANPTFDSSFLPLGCALLSALFNLLCHCLHPIPDSKFFNPTGNGYHLPAADCSDRCMGANIPYICLPAEPCGRNCNI